MVELVEFIVGAVLIGGAMYVVFRELGGGSKPEREDDYGTVPLPENIQSWLEIKNPEPWRTHTIY